jgi:hypothetical protein
MSETWTLGQGEGYGACGDENAIQGEGKIRNSVEKVR